MQRVDACSLAAWFAALCAATFVVGCSSFNAGEEKHMLDKRLTAKNYTPPGTAIAQSFRSATGRGPDEKKAREFYEKGEIDYRNQNLEAAAANFKTAAQRWPESSLEEDALFMEAESLFFANRYSEAIEAYHTLLKKYENTRHLEIVSARQFLIARYWSRVGPEHAGMAPNWFDDTRPLFDTSGHSLRVYQSIRLTDPTGPLADDALMATASTFFAKGKYNDADYYYTQLRKDYPRSEHQPKAHLLGVQSKLGAYDGSKYCGSSLDGAGKLVKSSLTQFPQELEEERNDLLHMEDDIHESQAMRVFEMGQYYVQQEHYRAARIYYKYTIDDYPGTQASQLAQQRLDEIKEFPDDAPERLAWLAVPFKPLERKRPAKVK